MPVGLPYICQGKITDSNSANPSGAPIVIRNDKTVETITVVTNSSGEYIGDIANLSGGWDVGDQITVIARYGLEEGQSSFTIEASEASQTVDITTSAVLDSTDLAYCTISEVLRELDDKTTTDISAQRVRDEILGSEAFIDKMTQTSFKSNTVTDEFYDTNDETMWTSAEGRLGFGGGGLARADGGLGGNFDTIQLRNKPLVSVTSLSKNTAGSSETDSFTDLTQQTGSGGDYITDNNRGLITFVNDKPYIGKKRAFKITYNWGLDRTATDRNTIIKIELVRKLCILLAVREILTSKGSSSQFSSTDSISLESISITKGVGGAVTFLSHFKERADELFAALGVFNVDVGAN